MKVRYVIAKKVRFGGNRKLDVIFAVCFSNAEIESAVAECQKSGHKHETVSSVPAKAWLGPGGKAAVKRALSERIDRIEKKVIDDRVDDEEENSWATAFRGNDTPDARNLKRLRDALAEIER